MYKVNINATKIKTTKKTLPSKNGLEVTGEIIFIKKDATMNKDNTLEIKYI